MQRLTPRPSRWEPRARPRPDHPTPGTEGPRRGLALGALGLVAILGACHASGSQTLPRGGAGLEARLAKVEAELAKSAEALEFLRAVYAQQKAQREEQEASEPAEDAVFAVDIADSVAAGHVEGPASAPVTIVEAFDFACPFCYRAVSTIDELLKDYPGKIRVVYLNFIVHPSARSAHLASCAAARQGKYGELKRALWEQGFAAYAESRDESKLGESNILTIAKGVGLDPAKLKADMASPLCAARLENDAAELAKFRVNATPTFFINGKFIGGALPKTTFAKLIDAQLAAVASSGVPAAEYYRSVVFEKGEKQFRSKRDPKPQ